MVLNQASDFSVFEISAGNGTTWNIHFLVFAYSGSTTYILQEKHSTVESQPLLMLCSMCSSACIDKHAIHSDFQLHTFLIVATSVGPNWILVLGLF